MKKKSVMSKSVLKPNAEHLIRMKDVFLRALESSLDLVEVVFPNGKRVTSPRADLERAISEIDQELRNQNDFEESIKDAVPLIHDTHFYWALRDVAENYLKKPKRSNAGKESGKKRAKKSAHCKTVFLTYYNEKRNKKPKLDKKVTDASIINSFIASHKKAPKDPSTYYGYLRNR